MVATLEADFVIIGSGAGGGPLACRLAQDKANYSVIVLGGQVATTRTGTTRCPRFTGTPVKIRRMSWKFFVKHYTDPARQKLDSKYNAGRRHLLSPGGVPGDVRPTTR